MAGILIISPHADDETLGCFGVLSNKIYIDGGQQRIIILCADEPHKAKTIDGIAKKYKWRMERLGFKDASFDTMDFGEIVSILSKKMNNFFSLDTIYFPYLYDAHTDHQIISRAVLAATKTFRMPDVKEMYMYEIISQTEYATVPFQPNSFIDISGNMKEKLRTVEKYKTELGKHPFPRSLKSVEALATLRGSLAGCKYAEAFIKTKEIR